MKLGIDIDGCLANFNESFGDLLIEVTGENKLPQDWKTDKNFPTTWNWHFDAGYTPKQSENTWEVVRSRKDFWFNLNPLEDAELVIPQLNRLSKAGHDVYFLTHRDGNNAKRQTEEWLEYYGMQYPTVLMSGNKLPILLGLGIDYFIDDKLATINEVARYVAETGIRLDAVLKDAPYNWAPRYPGVRSLRSVKAALEEIGLWQDTKKRGRPRKPRS